MILYDLTSTEGNHNELFNSDSSVICCLFADDYLQYYSISIYLYLSSIYIH